MIHGRNFRLNLDGEWVTVGFSKPRYTDAPEIALAEETAPADFRQSATYHDLMDGTLNSKDDPPILRGEDIEEKDPGEGFKHDLPGRGFYVHEDEENAEPEPFTGKDA